ncbi:MAG: VTT domain-containing protein [Byssovorax sp.]
MSPLADLPDPRRARNLRIAAVLGVVVVLLLAFRFGVFQQFGSPAQVKQTLVQLGPWGYLAFVVAYTVLQPFGVPGTVFVWAAPLIWPWPIAYALSMTGTMAASVVGFSFSRFIARDWVSARIPASFRKYNEALEKRAFVTVALLRFIFWMPQALHAFLGLSNVRFWTHFWGSLVGYAIPLFLVSFFGQRLLDWMKSAPIEVWIGLGVLAAAIAAWAWARGRRAASRVEPPPAPRLE